MPLTPAEETALDRWRPIVPPPRDPLATRELTVGEMATCLMLARWQAVDPLLICNRLAQAKDAVQQFLLSRQSVPVDPMTR